MTKVTAEWVANAHAAISEVNKIDHTIEWLRTDDIKTLVGWGDKIKLFLGQNMMGNFNSMDVGGVLLEGLVNYLLEQRAACVARNEEITFPNTPKNFDYFAFKQENGKCSPIT